MNYFKSFVSASEESGPSETEIVEKLCNRVESSTLLEDRRDAVRGLKSLSKKFRKIVGGQALGLIGKVLTESGAQDDMLTLTLDCLCNLMIVEELSEEEDEDEQLALAKSFVEKFILERTNVVSVIEQVENPEFSVRWGAIKLLTVLLRTKPVEVQQIVLETPMGVHNVMDLLSDKREVIRNDAILALVEVTKSNANIQTIVGFNNGFDETFKIMVNEGLSDGGVVVTDCLFLLINLLKNNDKNQKWFKESSFIQYLNTFFNLEADIIWPPQKKINILMMLKVVRTLVSPSNTSSIISSCQIAMQHCQLLQKLTDLLMATGVPTEVLTETISTVSEIIRGCSENQSYFSGIMAPWDPPRAALVVLLMSMVNNQQPFKLRCSVLYCFQCFLHKNINEQSNIVNTLLPASVAPEQLSVGQLLCSGLFVQADPLSNWLAATALCHSLKLNESAKIQLLRVQLATSPGAPPVTLLKQVTNIVLSSPNLQTKVGLLSFLCGWLHNCPNAVENLLADSTAVPFLLSQIAENRNESDVILRGVCALLLGICILNNNKSVPQYTKESLIETVIARIGIERFQNTVSAVTQEDRYTKAMQNTEPYSEYQLPDDLLLDHSFVKLYKQLEHPITNIVANLDEIRKEEEQKAAIQAHDAIVEEYKTLIRDQDDRLKELTKKCSELEGDLTEKTGQITSQSSEIQQLKDQYNVIKMTSGGASGDEKVQQMQEFLQQKSEAESQIESQKALIHELQEKLTLQSAEIEREDNKDHASDALLAEKVAMQNKIQELEDQLASAENIKTTLTTENNSLKDQIKSATDKANADQLAFNAQLLKFKEAEEQNDSIKKEQEDLLVLLSEQDTKLGEYKQQLRKLGVEVSDDEEEDDDDDDDLEENGHLRDSE